MSYRANTYSAVFVLIIGFVAMLLHANAIACDCFAALSVSLTLDRLGGR